MNIMGVIMTVYTESKVYLCTHNKKYYSLYILSVDGRPTSRGRLEKLKGKLIICDVEEKGFKGCEFAVTINSEVKEPEYLN
jgi:hypothetical protein